MAGPLEGVKVIELGALVAAPLAAGILADQGASVIKVEPPGQGDLMRHVGSSRGGMSGLFHVINRGKRSLALDLSDERGKQVLRQLVRGADVVVQNLRPGVVERMGIGWDDLRALNSNLVYLSLSGFGRSGPYAHKRVYDNVIQTYSGIAGAQTDPRSGEPGFVRQLVTDKLTGYAGAQAVCAALLASARGRGGQHVELSMLDTAIAFLWADAGADLILQGDGIAHQPGLGSTFALTRLADGWGSFTPFSDAEFSGACRALDAPELAQDPELATTALRMRNFERWQRAIRDTLARNAARLTRAEFEKRLDAHDVPHGVVRGLDELHLDPQVIAGRVFVERSHPLAGPLREARAPAFFRGTPAELGGPAPALGQHSAEILTELGLGARIAELRAAGVVAEASEA
jgi:crotonobetainyl-CoA:carnitine CoA-transferase CaiB-like acyl-CoA transferase